MHHFSRFFVLAVLLLWVAPAAFAQYFPLPDTTRRPALGVIKIAPLSLADPYNTFQAGFEYVPRRGIWSVQAEAGYGDYRTHFDRSTRRNFNTGRARFMLENWRLRSEARLYLEGRPAGPVGFYVAGETMYRRSSWRGESSIGRECEDRVCAFFELTPYTMHKDVLAFHGKAGTQLAAWERLLFDLYFGAGIRYVWVHSPQLGENDTLGENGWIFNIDPGRPGRYRLVSASLGFKVGYLLYRKN
jgi:hypothetical protein